MKHRFIHRRSRFLSRLRHFLSGTSLLLMLAYPYSQLFAADNVLHQEMAHLGQAISNLFPLAIDDGRFDAPQQHKILDQNINELVTTIPLVKSHFAQKSLTYQLSFDIIARHVQDMKSAYDNARYQHVRSMIRATASICVSCHSQDQSRRSIFVGFPRKKFKSDYAYAEYNYITRNYSEAEDYYLRYLNKPGQHAKESDQLIALKHLLSIYAQILNDANKGLVVFEKIKGNKHLSVYAKKQIANWMRGLKEIAGTAGQNKDSNFERIKTLVNQHIVATNQPTRLEYLYWIRGLSYRYLNAKPKPDEVPVLLYWLALTERGSSESVYFSLGDLYLKQCMLIYPTQAIAKQCYREYEDAIIFSYSGSRGTDIPDDIQETMKALKEKVFAKTATD